MNRIILVSLVFIFVSCAGNEECPVGTFNCGICTDLLNDPANCGACGAVCAQGHVCTSGACVLSCQEGYADCSGTCRDLMTDQYNCGTCGLTCAAGYLCIDGSCAPDCPDGYTSCSGICKNLTNDPANCGECSNACAAGEVCLSGSCSFTCPAPYIDCSGSCADLDTDHLNCGSCGNECLSGQVCEAGACANSCIAGLTLCSGACRDLMRDPENCGSCASRCGTGENCYDGSCLAACPGGFTDCSGTCRDLDSDRLNCGACENECLDGERCTGGTCVVTCESPLVSCPHDSDGDTVMDATMCSDTTSDPRNCGGCAGSGGVNCAYDEGCVSGACRPFVGDVGTVRMTTTGTWIPVVYVLCGSGAPGACTGTAAKAACTGIGAKVVSHASTGTTSVHSLGATVSCQYSTSYFTTTAPMPSGSCLVGVSNLDWTSCCSAGRWHGNTLDWGAPGAIFGYVSSGNTGYVSTYPNVSGTSWACRTEATASTSRSGCTMQYVACAM